jgi:salicylate hydroxylase
MALEDALALARCMAECPDDPAQAFVRFERERFVRTARVVLESRSLWRTYHCSGVDAQVRDQQLRERTAEDYYRCLGWLWNPQPAQAH